MRYVQVKVRKNDIEIRQTDCLLLRQLNRFRGAASSRTAERRNASISFNAMIAGDPTVSDEFEFTGPHTIKAMTSEAAGPDKQVPVIVDLADAVAKPLPPARK